MAAVPPWLSARLPPRPDQALTNGYWPTPVPKEDRSDGGNHDAGKQDSDKRDDEEK